MRGFDDHESTNVIEVDFSSPDPMIDNGQKPSATTRAANRGRFFGFCERVHLSSKVAVEIWTSIPTRERNTKEALVGAYFLAAELAIKRK